AGPPIEHPPPPPPLLGFFVGVGDGVDTCTHTPGPGVPPGAGVGITQTKPEGHWASELHAIGVAVGVGVTAGLKFSLTGIGRSIPSLVKQAEKLVQLWKFSWSSNNPGLKRVGFLVFATGAYHGPDLSLKEIRPKSPPAPPPQQVDHGPLRSAGQTCVSEQPG